MPPPLAVLVGLPSPERAPLASALAAAGLAVESREEKDLLAARAAPAPALLVLDDSRGREERLATQRRLRAHPPLHGVPLLVVSQDCGIDSFGGAIGAGASAFVRLPLDPADVQDVARRLAAWERPRSPPGSRPAAPRRPLLLDVDVEAPGHPGVRGRIVDASATGCRMELPVSVPEGSQLGIVPRSCEDSTGIKLGGKTRWTRRAADGYLVAVRWTPTSALLARRILGLPGA
jgi:CheY-like chemotaxis protein